MTESSTAIDEIDTIKLRGLSTNMTAVALTLGVNIENLDASDTQSSLLNLTGNVLNNVLTGNDAINTLSGLAGNDTLNGGHGNDVLLGGVGADIQDGGEGADIYIVALAADVTGDVFNDTGSSSSVDEIRFTSTRASTLTLSSVSGIEKVVIGTGTAATAVTTGRAAVNVDASAIGEGLTIIGNAGTNILTSGSGDHTLTGGLGNDIYVIDGADTIVEDISGGTDTVRTSVSDFTLGDNLENLTFTGAGAFVGTGNGLVNVITGGSGSDTLDGAGGVDSLVGGTGNDFYIVDLTVTGALQDKVTESSTAVDEIDTIKLRGLSTNTMAAALTLGSNLENLDASETQGSLLKLTGNTLGNVLTDNDASNTLSGLAGNDTLNGGQRQRRPARRRGRGCAGRRRRVGYLCCCPCRGCDWGRVQRHGFVFWR